MNKVQTARWFVFAALVLCLVLIGTRLLSLRDRVDSLDVGSTTGPIWYLSNIELDAVKLELALADFGHGLASPDEVSKRFDIMWSRLSSVGHGSTGAKIDEYGVDASALDDMFDLFKSNEELIQGLPQSSFSRESLELFRSELVSFQPALRAISLKMLNGTSQETKAWRDGLIEVSRKNTTLLVILILIFFALTALVFLEKLQTEGSLREKERLLQEARAANVAKSEFVSVMNHELRTPLSSIRGAIGLLDAQFAKSYSSKEQKLLGLAKRNTEHLSVLVQDLLDVERFGSGRIEMQTKPTEMADFFTGHLLDLKELGTSNKVNIVAGQIETGLTCDIDHDRVRQVLSNLVFNAVKFSDSGSTVSLNLTHNADNAIISVTDEGIGIPASSVGRVFDPFYQVDASNIRHSGGTGLGLSICKSIVNSLDGQIWLESVEGLGTTFYVSFPTHDASAPGTTQIITTAA